MESDIYKKELSIGEMLSVAWKYFQENFRLIFLLTLVAAIPINIILAYIPPEALLDTGDGFRDLRNYLRYIKLLEAFVGVVSTMAVVLVVSERIKGHTIDFWKALKKALSRWPAAIGTNVIAGICILFLTLLLIVPGVIFKLYWTFFIFAVILHDKFGFKAMEYSKKVVEGRWWKVLWYLIVFGFITAGISFMIGVLSGILIELFPLVELESAFEIALDSITDGLLAFFTVLSTVFFINFDHTKVVEKKVSDSEKAAKSDTK